jgi:exonuclease III
LGDGIDDKVMRSDKDYKNIADIIKSTGATILGIQEIENKEAIEKILKYLPGYKFILSEIDGAQNVGMIFKEQVKIINQTDYKPIAVEPHKTRPGLLVEFKVSDFDAYLLVVHLKSTSSYDSTDELRNRSFEMRSRQSQVCSDLVDSLVENSSEKDIIIVGDFNDSPKRTNNYISSLIENKNLTFLSADLMSCKFQYAGSIDHIIISQSVKQRYLAESIHLYDIYSAYSSEELKGISDHCPVVAVLKFIKSIMKYR